jgi:hypothetical protein
MLLNLSPSSLNTGTLKMSVINGNNKIQIYQDNTCLIDLTDADTANNIKTWNLANSAIPSTLQIAGFNHSSSAGDIQIKLEYFVPGGVESIYEDIVKCTVLKIKSLLPDKGQEVDDNDDSNDTKIFVVDFSETSGDTVSVAVTTLPTIAESKLPDSWNLTGGTGSSQLLRTEV